MIIYHVPEAAAGERWLPTLSRAQACARAYKAEFKQVHAGEEGRDLAQNVCWRMKELLKPVAVND